jgi:hypothetical protein
VLELIAAVIEDNCPIFWYLSKSDICLLIRHGGSNSQISPDYRRYSFISEVTYLSNFLILIVHIDYS